MTTTHESLSTPTGQNTTASPNGSGPNGSEPTRPDTTRGGRKAARVLPTTPLGQRSLGELVATLSRDVALLVHQEVELVKAELKATVTKIAIGAAGFVVALIALLFAVPVLSIAAALGVHALGISLGFSFLIIGGAYVLLALIAAVVGLLQLRKAKAPKFDSMKADLKSIARKPNPVPPTN